MQAIKKIAGDLLLFFYHIQRNDGYTYALMVSFDGVFENKIHLRAGTEFSDNILKITNQSSVDAYNSLLYLKEKSFLEFNDRSDTGGDHFNGFRVTAYGIDIIEGIERGGAEKNNFYLTFNIKLTDNINIESLMKMELKKFGLF